MVVDTKKEMLCVNQIVNKKTVNLTVEGDVIVPDIKPDILNSISTSGNVCMYKKEVMDGKIRLDGSVSAYIVYLADVEKSNIRGLQSSLDFTEIIEIDKCKAGMKLDECVKIKSIDCKVLNGRKINVKANLEIDITICSDEKIEIVNSINEIDNIQFLKNNLELNSVVGSGSNKVYAKDTISIDEIDNLAEILKSEINITNKDIKLSYNKVLAKAELEVKVMYLTEDDRIKVVNSMIPVMGFIDIQDISDDNICDTNYKVKNIILKPNNAEEHSIYIEVEIELSCLVYEKKNIDIIEDMYSPTNVLKFKHKNINTSIKVENQKDTCNIKDRIAVPEVSDKNVFDISVKPNIIEKAILNNQIMFEGDVDLEIMYESEYNNLDVKNVKLPYTFTVNNKNIEVTTDIDTNLEIGTQDFIVGTDGNIDVQIDLIFNTGISKKTAISMIDEVNLEDERQEEGHSMTIYFVKKGDSLWKIAKNLGSTMEDIARTNNIEDGKINPGQQLFIPRFKNKNIIVA